MVGRRRTPAGGGLKRGSRVNRDDPPKPRPFSLRASPRLMERVARVAAANGDSINETCVSLLRVGLAASKGLTKHWEELRPVWEQEEDFEEPDLATAASRVVEFAVREILRRAQSPRPPPEAD
jgi:hypothetical protein